MAQSAAWDLSSQPGLEPVSLHDPRHGTLEVVPTSPESAGLHPVPAEGKEVVQAEKEPVKRENAVPDYFVAEKDGQNVAFSKALPPPPPPGSSSPPPSSSPNRRKRRLWIVAAAIIAVIIVVIVIVVPVVVTRKSDSHNAKSSPSSPSPSSPSSNPAGAAGSNARIRSTSGAWNGTGIATGSLVGEEGLAGYLAYQQADGLLRVLRYSVDESSHQLVVNDSQIISQKASNGTAISATQIDDANPDDVWFKMVYVDDNGCLADVSLDLGNIDAPWSPGNMSANCLKAPTDNRAALALWASPWYSSTYDADKNSIRVWAGDNDGAMHEYVYDRSTFKWVDTNFTLPESYGYGFAAPFTSTWPNGTVYTTLLSAAPNGTLQMYYSVDGDEKAKNTTFPAGQWQGPVQALNTSPVLANTSAVHTGDNLVYVPAGGGLVYTAINASLPTSASAFGYGGSMPGENSNVMQGSDVSFFNWISPTSKDNINMYFYQTNGSDISWTMYDFNTNTYLNHGSLDIPP